MTINEKYYAEEAKKKMLAGKSNPCETFCKGETNSLEFNGSIDDGDDYSDIPF